ncbi:phosphate ABC transporter substrate-binding protein [Glaciecola sp. XM2]|jgi:ABC-type phosphate transport system substrate-binding protein|uniref:phosphate ABC transporter substrate-binding protein n=1 Tax=Glaciecola sp. XM2 TaxID=1914931 RepID=UPI001BDF6912|nr:phosphate ABC transporter substrate-binding protein [Glaciecola sp. XM2]MBT1450138.1 phosphate ABC transporter substrate-binding protein [Glaciecola sp. XM2]
MYKKMLASALLLFFAQFALAEIVVVVHPSNADSLDSKMVQRIFLGKEKKFPNGSETVPVNQSPESNVRQGFDQDVLGRSSSQVSAYWSKLVFTGKGVPPKEVSTDAEVIELVSQNPSVIGYIDRASATDAVKIVEL